MGSALVVMETFAPMVMGSVIEAVACVGAALSVTVMVGLLAPAAVGVPLITPLAAPIVSPPGRPVADQV